MEANFCLNTYMENILNGFQIIAANGLQSGEGIIPPNISLLYNEYKDFLPVANYGNIYSSIQNANSYMGTCNITTSNGIISMSSANANLLINVGSNSFPHIFGVVPAEFSSYLGNGPLMDMSYARTTGWFGNSGTANIFLQVLGQAQTYATGAHAVLSSASTTQWSGNPFSTATGGFSNIAGNNKENFLMVANVFIDMGSLMQPSRPFNGFSNAGCFKRIYDSGNQTIGNLHLNFFGKTITDPVSGNSYIIDNTLFNDILSNPMGLNSEDTFQIAALNPLDSVLGTFADGALQQTDDLDAVVTYFGVGPNIASKIYNWTDSMNVEYISGTLVSNIICSSLNIPTLNAYALIKGLTSSVSGLTNLSSMISLGNMMEQISPLESSLQLQSLSSPISSSDFSNIRSSFGNGSGTYGNPTVDDILGSTAYNQALSNYIMAITPLEHLPEYLLISSDSGNISYVLQYGFPTTGINLSNGKNYTNLDLLAHDGSVLLNQNANLLANIAPSYSNVSQLSSYNRIAQTHNNSKSITASNSLLPINVTPLQTNILSNFTQLSGLSGLILGIVHQHYSSSSMLKIDSPPRAAVFQEFPLMSNPKISTFAFPAVLSSMAAKNFQNPTADEVTGLNNLSNCIDHTSLTGQALNGIIVHTNNSQLMRNYGILTQAHASNPSSSFYIPPLSSTMGGL